MYSGITAGRINQTQNWLHIDINNTFDAGDTLISLDKYNGNSFKKGEQYQIVIEMDVNFTGWLYEVVSWQEKPIPVIRFIIEGPLEHNVLWSPTSDNCRLILINETEDLTIDIDWDWTIYQKQTLLDNPIDTLLFIRKQQNWDGDPRINETTNPGGFNYLGLDQIRQIRICRQILNYNDATTKALSKSICEEFNLALYTDNDGNESVKIIDFPEPDISFTITLDNIIKEPEIIERDPNKIYCEPVVKFATDWSSNNPTKQFSIISTDAEEYSETFTPGLTAVQGEPLWLMAKTLRQAVNIVTAHEYNFKWVYRVEDAIQLLARKFVWMSKKRMKLVVSYEKAINQTVGCWGKVIIPISTVGKEIRFIIEEMVSSKKRGKNASLISMQVVLWDNVTSEELEILQNQMYVILDQQLQGQVADETELMQDLTQDHL